MVLTPTSRRSPLGLLHASLLRGDGVCRTVSPTWNPDWHHVRLIRRLEGTLSAVSRAKNN